MNTRSLLSMALAVAAAALVLSCTADGGTIYATIEKETRTVDSSLPNTLNVAALARSAAGTYWVAAGTLYKGTLSGATVTWSPTDTADASRIYNPSAGALVNALAYEPTSGTWWGGFASAGASLGIYKASGADPTSWTAASSSAPELDGKQAVLFRTVAPNHLFVVSGTLTGSPATYVYEMDYSSNGSTWTATLPGQVSPFNGVATDGTSWFVSSPSAVYSDSSPGGAYATTEFTPAATDGTITGVFGDALHGRVFVLTTKGGIYYRTGLQAWTQAAAPTVGTATVSALSMDGPVDSTGASNIYLVGTDGYGYYRLTFSNIGSATSAWTRPDDTTTTTVGIYTASVGQLLDDGGTVLMGTHGLGVWRASFDTSTGAISGSWTHE